MVSETTHTVDNSAEILRGLNPEKVIITVHDLDDCLYRRGEPVGNTRTKVNFELKKTDEIALETGLSNLKAIVTGRPGQALLDKPALHEFLNLQSVIQKDGQQTHLPISAVFCELGAVALKRTETGWQPQVMPYFQSYCNETREKLHDWLNERYVKTGRYKFEEGTLVSLSLQSIDSKPVEKEKLAEEIKAAWEKENQTNFQEKVAILTEGADLDFYPITLAKGGKVHGLTEVLSYFREFLPGLSWENIIFADDSGAQAARFPALQGATIIAPTNASPKMQLVVNALADKKGHVSMLDEFFGIMDALQQAITKHPFAQGNSVAKA